MYITLASGDWCFKLKTQEQLPGHSTTAAKLFHKIVTQEEGSSKLWGSIPVFTYLVSLLRNGLWADITVVTYGLKPSGKNCNYHFSPTMSTKTWEMQLRKLCLYLEELPASFPTVDALSEFPSKFDFEKFKLDPDWVEMTGSTVGAITVNSKLDLDNKTKVPSISQSMVLLSWHWCWCWTNTHLNFLRM